MTRFATKITDGLFAQPNQISGVRLPDRSYLIAEYLLGGTEAESIKNRANSAIPLTVQGTGHVYNPASVTVRSSLTAGYGFVTAGNAIIPDANSTFILVRKSAASPTQPIIAGLASAGTAFGWNFHQFGANNHYVSYESSALNGGASYPRPATTGFYFEAGVNTANNSQWTTGGANRVYWYASGVQQTAVGAVTVNIGAYRKVMPGAIFALGSNVLSDSITTNTFEIAYAAIFNRPFTADEIDAAYKAIVAHYATRGVTVL
jgi:hypothetical protein